MKFFELFYCFDLHYDRSFNEDIGNIFSDHVLFIVNPAPPAYARGFGAQPLQE